MTASSADLQAVSHERRGTIIGFGAAIFLGAFLLFQIQPIIARFVLPWFGGTIDVWTTCMLYFQTMLLAGYAYAHLLVVCLRPRAQVAVHLLLVAAALIVLPIAPSDTWQPPDADQPVLRILVILLVCTGLPFLVLAATSPLLQSWFTRVQRGRSPYRYYAVSNAGSLLALASYPFIVEPLLGRIAQSWVWSGGFAAFAILAGTCAVRLWRSDPASDPASSAEAAVATPSLRSRLFWLLLPAVGSVMLLGTTNVICLDLAPVPFLWLAPLILYLLSFVLCFHHERWYRRGVMIGGLVVVGAVVLAIRYRELRVGMPAQVVVHLLALSLACMVCHGELFRLRPEVRRLTGYYLTISLGGAIGGALVAIVAPLVLQDYHEVFLMLPVCVALAAWAKPAGNRIWMPWALTLLVCVGIALAVKAPGLVTEGYELLVKERNFYGVLSVEEFRQPGEDGQHIRAMRHGTTIHGLQVLEPKKARREPMTYYGRHSGIGAAMRLLDRQRRWTIGVIGLGAGTIATYGRRGDTIQFYEINPVVEQMARSHFTYLGDSEAAVSVVLGDGRLAVADEPTGSLDVLVVDAFNSDAIPVHLLTAEAFEIYLDRLKPEGILALHLTNQYMTLGPVALRLADNAGWPGYWLDSRRNKRQDAGEYHSIWVLVSKRPNVLADVLAKAARVDAPDKVDDLSVWTDDYVNLLDAIRMR